MAYNLLPCDREQGYLRPPSLREWLPEGDLALVHLPPGDVEALRGAGPGGVFGVAANSGRRANTAS